MSNEQKKLQDVAKSLIAIMRSVNDDVAKQQASDAVKRIQDIGNRLKKVENK